MSIQARLTRLEQGQRSLQDAMVRGFWATMDRPDELTLPGRRVVCPICDRAEFINCVFERLSSSQ